MPLKDVFFVSSADVKEAFVDVVVIEIDAARVTHPEVAQATLINLDLACSDWISYANEAQLLGYPEEQS